MKRYSEEVRGHRHLPGALLLGGALGLWAVLGCSSVFDVPEAERYSVTGRFWSERLGEELTIGPEGQADCHPELKLTTDPNAFYDARLEIWCERSFSPLASRTYPSFGLRWQLAQKQPAAPYFSASSEATTLIGDVDAEAIFPDEECASFVKNFWPVHVDVLSQHQEDTPPYEFRLRLGAAPYPELQSFPSDCMDFDITVRVDEF